MEDNKYISEKALKHLIIDAEITVKKLASNMNVSEDYIRQILRGQRKAIALRKTINDYLTEVIKNKRG